MIHYNAKQRLSDMRWDYVCGNRPTGYCAGYREFTEKDDFLSEQMRIQENAKMAVHKEKYHTNGHETEEEARLCYKQYMLDNELRLSPKQENPSQLNKCDVCGEFCSGSASIGWCERYTLCEKHCTRDEVERLTEPAGEMWIS